MLEKLTPQKLIQLENALFSSLNNAGAKVDKTWGLKQLDDGCLIIQKTSYVSINASMAQPISTAILQAYSLDSTALTVTTTKDGIDYKYIITLTTAASEKIIQNIFSNLSQVNPLKPNTPTTLAKQHEEKSKLEIHLSHYKPAGYEKLLTDLDNLSLQKKIKVTRIADYYLSLRDFLSKTINEVKELAQELMDPTLNLDEIEAIFNWINSSQTKNDEKKIYNMSFDILLQLMKLKKPQVLSFFNQLVVPLLSIDEFYEMLKAPPVFSKQGYSLRLLTIITTNIELLSKFAKAYAAFIPKGQNKEFFKSLLQNIGFLEEATNLFALFVKSGYQNLIAIYCQKPMRPFLIEKFLTGIQSISSDPGQKLDENIFKSLVENENAIPIINL